MQNKHDEGFSLIEILVAIVILAAFVVPICGALLMSNEMNTRTDNLMQAQLAVSSAVEILMAEGIPAGTENTPNDGDYGKSPQKMTDGDTVVVDRFPDVIIQVLKDETNLWFHVTVKDNEGRITVETSIRAVKSGEVANEKT
jgi:prepilin-type N-terminal cleavage/methylation domain-containing protein